MPIEIPEEMAAAERAAIDAKKKEIMGAIALHPGRWLRLRKDETMCPWKVEVAAFEELEQAGVITVKKIAFGVVEVKGS